MGTSTNIAGVFYLSGHFTRGTTLILCLCTGLLYLLYELAHLRLVDFRHAGKLYVPDLLLGGFLARRFMRAKRGRSHPDLITRIDISLAWIKMEIERLYGAFPVPRLLPVSMNHREEILSHLAGKKRDDPFPWFASHPSFF